MIRPAALFALVTVAACLATASAAAEPPMSRRAVAEAVAERVQTQYVFVDKGAQAARLVRSHARSGAYDKAPSEKGFVDALTADLYSVTHDKHLVVRYSAAGYPQMDRPTGDLGTQEAERRAMARSNYAMPRVEVLDGNVGYLKLTLFEPPQDAGPTLEAAMGFLAHADAIIFDLRDNGGGDAAMVALALSYLTPPQTQFVSYRDRAGKEAQSWSIPYPPGGRWSTTKPVYVLVNGKTFSAAEEFAFDIKELKRGTIVGETSRGGANPGLITPLDPHHRMFVPNEVAIGAVSGGSWEGVGVTPDVAADPAQALVVAHRLALQGLLAKAPQADKPDIEAALKTIGE
jgi:hypothetical protein